MTTREKLLENLIYVPKKLDYDDVKLHYQMGYKVLAYSTHFRMFCFINHNYINKYGIVPCVSTRYLKFTNFGLCCNEPYNHYFIDEVCQL